MVRFKVTLEYEGGRYVGWQVQKGERTIQGACFDACDHVFENRRFEFFGSGRTDGGVHALRQVAHLEVDTNYSGIRIKQLLNEKLPYDINILDVEKTHSKFHARYDATARSYIYLISKRRTAFGKPYIWWIKDTLDINRMRNAASEMVGFKDFKSFTDKDAESKTTKVDLTWIDIHESDDIVGIHIVGSHFLWKMVRRMVGVLVEVGKGKLEILQVRNFFTQNSEIPAKLTAPSSGLFLENVYYNNDSPKRGANILLSILSLK